MQQESSVLTALFVIVAGWSAPSVAAKRPVTYVADSSLSAGPVENFRELYVDPRRLRRMLTPLNDIGEVRAQAKVTKDGIELSDRVFFAANSHEIKPSSAQILDAVANVMLRRPDIASVEIRGFSNALGSADDNLALSVRRTKAVVDHLTAKGVDAKRLSSIGFGSAQPGEDSGPLQFVIQRWQDVPGMKEVGAIGEDASAPAKDGPKTGSLLITNDAMTWAEIAVNGTKVGVVGPLTEAAVHGLRSGLYDIALTHPTGFTKYRAQRTEVVKRPIVPGGKPAVKTLPNDGLPVEAADSDAAE
jgi:outer membrane protein OmpA-like peptidoglycan-associated protein